MILIAALLSLLGIADPFAQSAWAAGTDPTLALQSARVIESSAGANAVEATGVFQFDDLVQFSFPAGLFVSQGASYVRYGLDGSVAAGSDASVGNGITASEVPALLSAGGAAGAPAAVLRVNPTNIAVALPASFGSGAARLIVYAVLDGEAFVSNSLTVTIP